MVRKTVITILMTTFFGFFSVSAIAGEQAMEDSWDFSLAPLYVWMVDMEGTMGVGPFDTGLNVDFGTLFDNLEAIFTVHFEAIHNSNIGIFADYNFVDVSASGPGPQGLTTINIDFDSTIAELGVLYRFKNGPHALDALGGFRFTKLEPAITRTPIPPALIPPAAQRSLTEEWTDPIIGARYSYDFGNNWILALRADIGGFGVGSDFTWNAFGFVQWKPWKYAGIIAGYRALDQDYEDGSGANRFAYDMRLAGPLLALNFVW